MQTTNAASQNFINNSWRYGPIGLIYISEYNR